jgi:positive regulator of sigma E activity
VGITLIALAFLVLVYLFVRRVFFGISVLGSRLFQISTMVAIFGFQSILMGLIAELLVRTYHESQGKPTYTVRKTLNFPPDV